MTETAAVSSFQLSPQQERLWARHGNDLSLFVAQCELRSNAPWDETRLNQAVRDVFARHESVRTILERQPGFTVPFQVIQPELPVALRVEQGRAFFTVPALLADRRSLLNLAKEIQQRYAGKTDADDAMQYVDVVEWQRELLASEDSKPGRDFWRQYLRNVTFEPSSSGGFHPGVVVQRLQASTAWSAELLLACWQVFIWRMIGKQSAIAMEFDGRKYAELDSAVGLFAKYLPIYTPIDPEMPFETFLQQTKSTVAEAAAWQDAFSWPEGEQETLPFAFDYEELPVGVSAESLFESFELKLSVRRGEEDRLEFHFDTSRYQADVIESWSGYFVTLLNAALATPATPIGRLPLLDSATKQRVLVDWNATDVDFHAPSCLHQIFELQARLTPEGMAVRSQDAALSYRELNEQANQLSFALRAAGLQPGALCGLCLDRGVEMIVALLAIMKAGAAYVPLAADQPKPRLAQQFAGLAALVTESKYSAKLPDFQGPVLYMDRNTWKAEPSANPALESKPSDLAYVIYTSGSTGTPKGVGVRHSNLVNYALFIRRLLGEEGLRFATVSTLAADLGNTCIYPSLISGGCLDVIPYDVSADSEKLRGYAARQPYDVLKIVPSHLAALLETGGGADILPKRFLVLGGEALPGSLVDRIAALNPSCEVINHYGPTETTVGSLTLPLKHFHPAARPAILPIGKPIANTAVYVLDPRQEPVPPGVVGELYISGNGVASGYIGQPERTAERFLPDPFTSRAGQTMYRTGDLVRHLPDGNVEFLGRADDQVKIRGFRVELGEVETVLATYSGVKQAVVIARSGENGEKRLLAYVTAHRDQSLDAPTLRAWLKEQLPDHMIPAGLAVLPRLPLTSNGKIDRQNLPEPADEAVSGQHYAEPKSTTEVLLAGIWSEVLRRDRVGLDDNFFDIGGHSLLATQVVSRVRRSLEIDLQLRAMFDSPTVRQLAVYIDQSRQRDEGSIAPPIVRVPRDRPLPLSFIQQRLWVIDRLQPGNPVYNIPRTLRFKGTLDLVALESAVNKIVERHESQRTTFPAVAGEPVQAIADSLQIPLPVEDLSGFPESEREEEARRRAKSEALRPFDLQQGPLVRTTLLRLTPEDHVFLLTVHHIISDGWSAGIFLSELGILYEAFKEGKPSALPELTIQCADYAAWQREWLRGDVLKAQIDWWRDHLNGAPPVLELPADRPRSDQSSLQGVSQAIPLSPGLTETLRQVSQKEDVTLFITLLAAFQALLARYAQQEHIVVGTDVANRTSVEVENLIGCFINVLAIHTDLSGNPTFRELLARVRKVALGAWAHQDIPFDKLVQELQPERSLSHNPIVQVLFVMQNVPAAKRAMADLELVSFPMPVNFSKFDLALFMAERDGRLTGHWVYRTDLFDSGTIQRFARQFEMLLVSAAAEPETRLSALDMLSAEEKQQESEQKKARKQLQRQSLMGTAPKPAGGIAPD